MQNNDNADSAVSPKVLVLIQQASQLNISGRLAASQVACQQAVTTDLAELQQIRQGLRSRMLASPICQGEKGAIALEQAFRTAWKTYCKA